MKIIVFIFLVVILFIPFISISQTVSGTINNKLYSLKHDTTTRTYIVHIPVSYNSKKLTPLVLVLHGGGNNATQWMSYCRMNETADKNGFIVVYPNGTGQTVAGYEIFGWNGGPHVPGGTTSHVSKADDVGFINLLIDTLEKQYNIDSRRVYAAGMSMGAMMVFRLASELSNRFAAIAAISGPMGTEQCNPSRPVSIIYFHGTDDPAVPFYGGKGKIDPSGNIYYSVDYTLRSWLKANGCNSDSNITRLPDKVDDSTLITKTTYRACNNNAGIILYKIDGGGHTWPGRDFGPELKVLGKSTKNIYANDLIWEFFEKHPMN